MAEKTAIQWTDATVNFWWGCTKVGPGCDHCYAETWSKRHGESIWGVGAPRRKIKSALKTLQRLDNNYSWWAADHQIGGYHDHSPQRVFLQSMSDLFDSEVPVEWFAEAWAAITASRRLELQLVTTRLPNVEKRLAEIGGSWPSHAGLIISVVNQAEADRDIPRLLALKQKLGIPWVGLSMEPLLGPVDLNRIHEICDDGRGHSWESCLTGKRFNEWGGPTGDGGDVEATRIDWVIVGGESGPHARPMSIHWARSLRDQCAEAGVPFLFKQWGEWASAMPRPEGTSGKFAMMSFQHDNFAHTSYLDHYPRQFTAFGSHIVERVGKKAAGRLLDGKEHNGFPVVHHG